MISQGLELEMLQEPGENYFCLDLRERRANAKARPSAKRDIGK